MDVPVGPTRTSRRRQELLELLDRMNPTIEELTAAVEREARKRPEALRRMTHPGVGPLTALACVLICLLQRSLCHICSLRSFGTLDNLELHHIPFVQGFVAFADDSCVMDKHIRASILADEAIPFRVIEPLDRALHLWA